MALVAFPHPLTMTVIQVSLVARSPSLVAVLSHYLTALTFSSWLVLFWPWVCGPLASCRDQRCVSHGASFTLQPPNSHTCAPAAALLPKGVRRHSAQDTPPGHCPHLRQLPYQRLPWTGTLASTPWLLRRFYLSLVVTLRPPPLG